MSLPKMLSLYVSGRTGSDVHNCGRNLSTPCKTVMFALHEHPDELRLLKGTYNATALSLTGSRMVSITNVADKANTAMTASDDTELSFVAVNSASKDAADVVLACNSTLSAPLAGKDQNLHDYLFVSSNWGLVLSNLTYVMLLLLHVLHVLKFGAVEWTAFELLPASVSSFSFP